MNLAIALIAQGRFSEPPLWSFANFPCSLGRILEVVNGVPAAVKDEAVVTVKGEPVVDGSGGIEVEPHSVTASDPVYVSGT